MGRPLQIDSPETMLELGERYFADCKANGSHITVTGLVLAIGLSCRDSLIEYGKREKFADTVKRLKTVCENYAESRIYSNNPAGAIFALKNYGWTDKVQVGGDSDNPLELVVRRIGPALERCRTIEALPEPEE